MKSTMTLLGLTSIGILNIAMPAYADDITECADKLEGDTCVQEDGEVGVCDLDQETQVVMCSDNGLTADQMACQGLDDGDDCTLSDGEDGVCDPDSDTAVLACSSIDPDRVACEGLADGDVCTQSDGEVGVCDPDSDTGVLECSDNGMDGDNTPCENKVDQDTCNQTDGTSGICTPDEDSGVLECSAIESDDNEGCAASPSPLKSGGIPFVALAIGALALARRKRVAR